MSQIMSKKKQLYVKKDPIDHVLERPDMYVGSTRFRRVEQYVVSDELYHIEKRMVNVSPAILRIFIEPLSNAIDNVARSKKVGKKKVTKICIDFNEETGETSIWNDGEVIPIEMHSEEKCYNHSLIFGQMLTSSNYDDDEDREDISGRNGLGCKLCLKSGTELPLYSGDILKIEDVQVGDELIGDDGTTRKVLGKVSGSGKLYEVKQARGDPYVVNENHILSVRMPDHKVIFWNTAKNGWSMLWLDSVNKSVHMKSITGDRHRITCPECSVTLSGNLNRHYKRVHKDIPIPKKTRKSPTIGGSDSEASLTARKELEEFASLIPDDNTMDISIQDYMKLSKTAQSRLSGFVGECVQWEERDVALDPYVLGLWLGDGCRTGQQFAINAKEDPEILSSLEEWGNENDATFKQGPTNLYLYSISSTSKSRVAPLKKLLLRYNLIKNKHIPKDYIVNSRKVRLAVLAGLIDSDGHVCSDGRRITIAQGMNHIQLAYDIVFLAKSLGFMCSHHVKKTQWSYKGELKRGNAININISGNGVEDIPVRVIRKTCVSPLRREVTNTGKLSITQVDDGEYIGLEVDSNNRFVLKDFTVTHNCNVFSKRFTVEGVDPSAKKHFKQTWANNMKSAGAPTVTKTVLKKGYTCISYTPDFAQLGIEGYTTDILDLYKRFVVDAAMISKVPIYMNDELIPISSLQDYAKLYSEYDGELELLSIKTADAEVVVTPANEFQAISFANGVFTPLGGTHVDAWTEAIFRPLVMKLNKAKGPQVNIKDVKQYFRLFVSATVKKPEFDSQSKTRLEAPPMKAESKKSYLTAISKWSVMERLEDILRAKEMMVLKKVERKKRGYTKIESLDSANNEGGPRSTECTLILVEGLSAKSYATQGIGRGAFKKEGPDWFGIYALRGKCLNTRNATTSSISNNNVVTDIIKSLGLQVGVDYTDDKNYKKLRYGRVMIVTDADVDGIHISGLIQNLFHSLFPSLLLREQAFITSMQTPIVRIYLTPSKKKSKLFYDEREYRRYVAAFTKKFPNRKISQKYYKGLASSNEEDIDESFGLKLVEFRNGDQTFDSMNKAFHKKYADMRKQWLKEYDPTRIVLKWKGGDEERVQMTYSDFIDTELIKFSLDDCARSIPSLMDGMKEGHRKVLYVCLLRKLKYGKDGSGKTVKVAQLAGSVAEKSGYHHGENNLFGTITNMACTYVGSNNIPLLFRDGAFGTRLQGGKDAGNGRYIWTKLDQLTRLIFREEDDELLEHNVDDGDVVEPRYYAPIIPMVLVNGNICGIGTGWSSTIPCYNPMDLITCIRVWLDTDGPCVIKDKTSIVSLFPTLVPWYRGHTGQMEATSDPTKFISWGTMTKTGTKAVITELPVGVWTNKYKEKLEKWKEEKEITNFKSMCTPKDVNFTVTENEDGMLCNPKTLGLQSTIRTSNMCLFSETGGLKKYDTPEEIIDEYCSVRYNVYVKRKAHQLVGLEHTVKFLGNKKRFLMAIRDGGIKLFENISGKRQSRKLVDLVAELEEKGYDKEMKTTTQTKKDDEDGNEDDEDDEDETKGSGYDYLLRLQFRSITEEKINKLQKDIDSAIKERDTLASTSEKNIWISELDEFIVAYTKWLKVIAKEKVKIRKPRKKN